MERIELAATERERDMTPRQMRRKGRIPAVMYGRGEEGLVLEIEEIDFKKALNRGGQNAIFEVSVADEETKDNHVTMIKEIQRDPVSGEVLHVDLYRISMDETIITTVPINTEGEPVGVKEGGLLQYQIREVEVECLPAAIPDSFEIDISELDVGDNLAISDLPDIEGVEVLDDQEEIILSIVAPTMEEEEEEEEEELDMEPELVGEEEDEEEEEEF